VRFWGDGGVKGGGKRWWEGQKKGVKGIDIIIDVKDALMVV